MGTIPTAYWLLATFEPDDPDGKLRVHSLNDQQDFFMSTGLQTTRMDFSKIIDTKPAEQAAAKLGPYK